MRFSSQLESRHWKMCCFFFMNGSQIVDSNVNKSFTLDQLIRGLFFFTHTRITLICNHGMVFIKWSSSIQHHKFFVLWFQLVAWGQYFYGIVHSIFFISWNIIFLFLYFHNCFTQLTDQSRNFTRKPKTEYRKLQKKTKRKTKICHKKNTWIYSNCVFIWEWTTVNSPTTIIKKEKEYKFERIYDY